MAEDAQIVDQKPIDPLASVEQSSTVVQGDRLQVVQEKVNADEAKLQNQADELWFPETAGLAFKAGSNVAVNVYQDLSRMYESGPADPEWMQTKHKEWMDLNKYRIPEDQAWRYMRTGNQAEAQQMLQDSEKAQFSSKLLARTGGFDSIAAPMLAGLFDVDLPVMAITGGIGAAAKLGLNATRAGRAAAGATSGLLAGTALGGIDYQVNPNASLNDIVTYGLTGAVLGAGVGAMTGPRNIETRANTNIEKTLDEFGETIADGQPLASRDIRSGPTQHDDVYGSQAVRDAEEFDAELQKQVKVIPSLEVDKLQFRKNAIDLFTDQSGRGISKEGQVIYDAIPEDLRDAADKFFNGGLAQQEARDLLDEDIVKDMEITWAAERKALQPKIKEFYKKLDELFEQQGASPAQSPAQAVPAAEGPIIPGREPRALSGNVPAKELDEAAAETGIPDPIPNNLGASVGARQLNQTGPGVASIRSTRERDMIRNAKTRVTQLSIENDLATKSTTATGAIKDPVLKAAGRFQDAVISTGFVSDADRMFRSGSALAMSVGYDLLEHASGIIRNNRSGAALMEHYHKQLQGAFLPYHDAFDTWTKKQNITRYQKTVNSQYRRDFDDAVATELQARYHDGPNTGQRAVDPNVTEAADAIDAAFAKDVELNKGKPGEGSTKGYETLEIKSGYMPQRVIGAKIEKLIKSGRKVEDVIEAYAEALKRSNPAMLMPDARIYATAVIERSRRNEAGMSSNIFSTLADPQSRSVIEDMFRRNGMKQNDIDSLIDRLAGTAQTKGQASHTKSRMTIDQRAVSSNGIRIMDLMETDMNKLMAQRLRRGAGSAALARKGIYSKADVDDIIRAILSEQQANGANPKSIKVNTGNAVGDELAYRKDQAGDYLDSDKHLTKEELENIFSYFGGGPISGGISPAYARVMKLTRLATLNGLGLTQLAETATTIAGVGIKRFFEMAPKEIADAMKNRNSPLVAELKHMNILVPEERMFRDDLTHEFEKDLVQNEYMAAIDNMMNKAQRLQGFTSGFYQVRNMQQRIAVTAGVDKIVNGIRRGSLSPMRAKDMGLDVAQMKQIDKYIRNGTIEFEQGSVKKLNFDKWDPADVENFSLNLNRIVNQDVQKAMAGESAQIFHKDGLTSLFWQLKAFPMLAMEKQAYRNLRMMDEQAAMTFLYGLGTAASVYSIRQTMNGNTEKLNIGDIAQGAFGMSNLTGWIPMWVDPLAGMLGMNELKLSGYGRYGAQGVVSVPASFGVMDRMAQIPGRLATLPARTLGGDGLTKADINAFQATPLIGNAYGFSTIFNLLKDHAT